MKRWAVAGAALYLALVYLLNLGSLYAPTNGDEMVYLRIARLTAESGHSLPLVSDLKTPTGGEMRNTKPPLLFWQAMWAGQIHWDLQWLRLPYTLQTLLCACLVAYLTYFTSLAYCASSTHAAGHASLTRQPQVAQTSAVQPPSIWGTPLLAAALYLGFFSTYRYGRPALPSSTESLFLFALCTVTLMWKTHQQSRITPGLSRFQLAVLVGLLCIPALWVKSFVLIAPCALWLGAVFWTTRRACPSSLCAAPYGWSTQIWQSVLPTFCACAIGLMGFALWFALDPNPEAIWREFIVGENFSNKFHAQSGDSLWAIALAPLLNAGWLAPLVLGSVFCALRTVYAAWQHKRQPFQTALQSHAPALSPVQIWLWFWVVAWLLVFSVPSTRSARYVIPVMPALAVLLALSAPQIHRLWWQLSLMLIALATAALGWVAWCLDGIFAAQMGYDSFYFLSVGAVMVLCVVGFFKATWRIVCTALAATAWLALLGALAMPFDAPTNQYSPAMRAQMQGQTVLVPQNFNAQSERFNFVLPGAHALPYEVSARPSPQDAAKRAGWIILLDNPKAHAEGSLAPYGKTMATRWALRSRHASGVLTWRAFFSRAGVQQMLIEQEILVEQHAL